MEIPSHTVLFTQIEAHHWNSIENLVLVIWLMSGMLVFDLDIIAIDGPEMARCHGTFPRSTCNTSTKWSAPLEWHRKLGPSNMALMPYYTAYTQWGQIWCDQWNFLITGLSFLYILTIPHTWPILLRQNFWFYFNGVLHSVLQILRGNILCHQCPSYPGQTLSYRSWAI